MILYSFQIHSTLGGIMAMLPIGCLLQEIENNFIRSRQNNQLEVTREDSKNVTETKSCWFKEMETIDYTFQFYFISALFV